MEKKTLSPQLLQKRKFFVVLPLLVVPFLTLIFWVLDGGKGHQTQASVLASSTGLNSTLPPAYFPDDSPLDKLSYYEKAALDSTRLEKLIKNDPYYSDQTKPIKKVTYSGTSNKSANPLNTSLNAENTPSDPLEAQVYQKLQQLNTVLQKSESQPSTKIEDYTSHNSNSGSSMNKQDIDRLEQMMGMMNNGTENEGPEMSQLNDMLEKILDIQHPERMQSKIQNAAGKSKNLILPVTSNKEESITLLTSDKILADTNEFNSAGQLPNNRFYSWSEELTSENNKQSAILAVIHETQTLVNGSVVKLRLVHDALVNGVLLPEGSFVHGTASLNGERLNITNNKIHYQNSIYPVKLEVFDLDGISGLYIPGAITREVAKHSTDQATQGIGISTLDPSLSAQAANAGLEMAKTLISKKSKLVKVSVKAGYQVLLQSLDATS